MSVVFIMEGGFLHIEVVEGNIGVAQSDGVMDGRGIVHSSPGFKDVSE